jgi:RNA polymerase sigma factor (sigma-70 family)
MDLKNNQWDLADKDLNIWLNENKHESSLPLSDILKSTYLSFRQKQIGRISDFCKNAFEVHQIKEQGRIEEPSIRFRKFKKNFTPTKGLVQKIIGAFEEPMFSIKSQSQKEINESISRSNEIIISGIIKGDEKIYTDLYEYEFPKVVKLVINNSGSVDIAKDVFQDALVILIEKVYTKKLDLTCSVNTYLYSICRFLWMDQLRQNKREMPLNDSYDYIKADVTVPGFEKSPDIFENVNSAIESLGEPCKELLEYFYYKNLSWSEIASRLGYSNAASARNQKYKCLERIRKTVNIEVD